jgi:hypothetical protein
MSCNQTDIEYLSDEINFVYHKFINAQFFVGTIILISNISVMIQNNNILAKIKEIKQIMYPPLYKPSV